MQHPFRTGTQIYIGSWLLTWLLLGGLVLMMGYEGSFLWLNGQRFPWADWLMPHVTHVGDGLIISGLAGLFVARRDPTAWITLLVTMVLVALLIAFEKQILFADWHRPARIFEGNTEIS